MIWKEYCGNKKDDSRHLPALTLKGLEECQPLPERGRLRKPCPQG